VLRRRPGLDGVTSHLPPAVSAQSFVTAVSFATCPGCRDLASQAATIVERLDRGRPRREPKPNAVPWAHLSRVLGTI